MSKKIEEIKALLGQCTAEEQLAVLQYLKKLFPHVLEKEWGIESEIILSSIARSTDLTKRGMRGIIAEAVFSEKVVVPLTHKGWTANEILDERPYDFLIQ